MTKKKVKGFNDGKRLKERKESFFIPFPLSLPLSFPLLI
jgi:hypothetical protein